MEHGYRVITLLLRGQVDHFEVAVLNHLLLAKRPILAALGPTALQASRRHHDHDALLLPNHPPKITIRLGKRALSGDESVLLFVSVHVVRVDVVRAGIVRFIDGQDHSTMVIAQHIRVTVLGCVAF